MEQREPSPPATGRSAWYRGRRRWSPPSLSCSSPHWRRSAYIVLAATRRRPPERVRPPTAGTRRPNAAVKAPAAPPAEGLRERRGRWSARPPRPAGAVVVSTSQNLNDLSRRARPGPRSGCPPARTSSATAPFAQVIPKEGNRYIGAPGAVLDGRQAEPVRVHRLRDRDVTIKQPDRPELRSPRGTTTRAWSTTTPADGWTIEHSTIQDNSGAGADGRRPPDVVRGNCLREQRPVRLQRLQGRASVTGIVVEGNEIAGQQHRRLGAARDGLRLHRRRQVLGGRTAPTSAATGCTTTAAPGCGPTPTTTTSCIEGNYIEDNDGRGARSTRPATTRSSGTTRFAATDSVKGRAGQPRRHSRPRRVYMSESGGDQRVRARTDKIEISGTCFTDNWSGMILWENADRFCRNSPANTSPASARW